MRTNFLFLGAAIVAFAAAGTVYRLVPHKPAPATTGASAIRDEPQLQEPSYALSDGMGRMPSGASWPEFFILLLAGAGFVLALLGLLLP